MSENKYKSAKAAGIILLLMLLTVFVCGYGVTPVRAETAPAAQSMTVAERLIMLGFLSPDYTGDMFTAAVRDFRKANNLPDGDTIGDAMDLLMSDSARSQSEYIAAKAQSMQEQSTLSEGAYGESVLQMQKVLAMYGYFDDECNGAFNESTVTAVRRFQLASGLNVTGIADRAVYLRLYEGEPQTYDAFTESLTCKQGDAGDSVRIIQGWLRRLGYRGLSESGSFGMLTARAVSKYQNDRGIPVSGAVDAVTAYRLTEDILQQLMNGEDNLEDTEIEAGELKSLLAEAGFEADDVYNSQTELAVMKYQKEHGLEVTGKTDAETLRQLRSGTIPVSQDEWADVTDPGKRAEYAFKTIGKKCAYHSGYGLIEYVFLKCGGEIDGESDASTEHLFELSDANPGDVIKISGKNGGIWGIYYGNGGIICVREGIAALYYPDSADGTEILRVIT